MKKKRFTLLGVDPGLRKTGFGLIAREASALHYITSGTIETDSKKSDALRLKEIFIALNQIVKKFRPDKAVVERVFANSNPKTTLALGQARGASITALAIQNIDVFELSPTEIKKFLVGNGHADKNQVQFMVKSLLNLEGNVGTDSSDALACALALERVEKIHD
ncbi:MAG: crossover junction endodeoxyribonuclease RuvC [Betaproteobacteria bacterium TMED82]|nr:MAG: crossover junction endodeoxyribonuclease RuvC [Betaproteobacteria bacterium TMED82]